MSVLTDVSTDSDKLVMGGCHTATSVLSHVRISGPLL